MDKSKKVGKWLDRLQRESWNLELLISGFSIFLLLGVVNEISNIVIGLEIELGASPAFAMLRLLIIILAYGVILMLINLTMHLVLRGLWIGVIGLRSVRQDKEEMNLKMSPCFEQRLLKKIPNIDDLILKLDRLCSSIFAISFLIVFMMISIFCYSAFFALVLALARWIIGDLSPYAGAIGIIALVYVVFGLIYMIDTLSFGWIKRIKWFSKVYYPIYLLMTTVTLSFLYRGIYYNMLSRLSQKKLRLVLVPYLLIVVMLPFFTINHYTFYPDQFTDYHLDKDIYEELIPERNFIDRAVIPKRIVSESFVPLFIRYDPSENEYIARNCDGYEPSKKKTFYSGIKISKNGLQMSDPMIEEEDPYKLLSCLTNYYQLYVNDSLYQDQKYFYYVHPHQDEIGIKTMLPVGHLTSGEHAIKIVKNKMTGPDSTGTETLVTIPFWKE